MSLLLRRLLLLPKPSSSSSPLRPPPPLRYSSVLLFSTSSATPSPSAPPPFLSLFDPLDQRHPDAFPSSSEIASAVGNWFRLGTDPLSLLDRIYAALDSCPDDGSLHSSLASLRIPLSEPLVVNFLRHSPHPSVTSATGRALLLLRLRFFDWAGHQHPYFHSRGTYHAVFRLLSRAQLASVIIDWLRAFSSSSPELRRRPFLHGGSIGPTPRFNDTLVVGYAVAGKQEQALQIFARMRFHGLDLHPFAYHVLLNSLVEASMFDFADALHGEMSEGGITGPVSACIQLKSLCYQRRLAEAETRLRELAASPMITSRTVASHMVGTVVRAYCRKGKFEKAGRIVDEFGFTEVYGLWIGNLVSAGKLDAVLEFLVSKKSSEDYIPESFHYSELVFRLLEQNRLEDVYNVLVEMIEEGIAPDRLTMNSALCFFCKAGMVDVALLLYNSRRDLGIDPSSRVYDNLINALCRGGNVNDVCLILEDSMQQGHFPGKRTFNVLANFLCQEGRLDEVNKLLDGALQKDVKPLPVVFARYMSALFKAGNLEEACLIPKILSGEDASMLGRYKATYVNLIHAFILLRQVDVLPQLILEMQEFGHIPSQSLYRSLVCCLCEMGKLNEVLDLLNRQLERQELHKNTCYNYFIDGAAHAKKPEMAKELYYMMQKAGIEPSVDTSILILKSYLKSKQIGDAFNFFNYMCNQHEPRTKFYNIFITGLCEAGKVEQAVMFWKEARVKGHIPSLQCYEDLVLELSSNKDYHTLVKVIEDFLETGRPISAFLCNVLILHTLKSQDLRRAWIQSRESNNAGAARSASSIIDHLVVAFSGGIRMKERIEKLDELLERFFPLDVFTYNMLMRGMCKEGRIDFACQLFHKMSRKGFEPNRWSFDILVHGFCKLGNRSEAERWMEKMYRNGFHPTWYTMRIYNNTT
ncbi:pentatricopeptide repeat-containing protein At1g71210, mitochondrial-like [Curcuma longa]|uniref:pentatricopeptide repeat-containing protein At1g71210, mitochondrial-like n=1 Tax=Curcuma longa TaxID=136217 RepID=UPI003D9E8A60